MAQTKKRAEYDPREDAKKVLKKLDIETLQSKEQTAQAVADHGIKIHGTSLGKLRVAFLEENGHSNGKAAVSMTHVDLVIAMARKMGGLTNLENAIAAVKRIKEKLTI